MHQLATLGRWLFAIPFFVFGFFHISGPGQLAAFVPALFPGNPVFWVILTGVVFLAGALAIAFQKYDKEMAAVMGIQLAIFVLTIWLPQLGGENAQMATTNLLKDTALAGAALMVAGMAAKRESSIETIPSA